MKTGESVISYFFSYQCGYKLFLVHLRLRVELPCSGKENNCRCPLVDTWQLSERSAEHLQPIAVQSLERFACNSTDHHPIIQGDIIWSWISRSVLHHNGKATTTLLFADLFLIKDKVPSVHRRDTTQSILNDHCLPLCLPPVIRRLAQFRRSGL